MKRIIAPLGAALMMATPLFAQQEPAMQVAVRMDACQGRSIVSADWMEDGRLGVSCRGSAVGGQGGAAAGGAAGGAAAALGLGAGAGALVAPALGLVFAGAAVAAVSGGSSTSDTQ